MGSLSGPHSRTITVFLGTALLLLVGDAASEDKKKPEEVCEGLKSKDKLYKLCLESEVVKQKQFIPKHLRPPWMDIPALFDDNNLKDEEKRTTNCYTCYKGALASNGKIKDEEYCACQYENDLPDEGFGKLFGSIDLSNASCKEFFYDLAMMPKCGNGYYDHTRHCAIVHFYKNNPNTAPDGAETMRTLVLLDGCVTGASKDCTAAKVKIAFKEKATGFFSGNCDDQEKIAFESGIDFKLLESPNIPAPGAGNGTGADSSAIDEGYTFTIPVLMEHRKCSGLGAADVSDTFDGITINIDCDGSKSFSIRSVNAAKGRVQEMRGLQLNMADQSVKQWFDDAGGYNYKQTADLKWQPISLSNLKPSGKSNEPPY